VRNLLADLALWRAEANQLLFDEATNPVWRQRFRARAEWWHDVSIWVEGLASWRDLKARRKRRLQPRAYFSISGRAR